ncbi:hypothetical protein TNCV_621651 [Trichonephila clavipes]|nr:hypothetical protein TNCV_621651 [Trichonephila clavipes]
MEDHIDDIRTVAVRHAIADCEYVPPLPADFRGLRSRIKAAVVRIASDTLNKVWDELAYRLDVSHDTNGAHVEHL